MRIDLRCRLGGGEVALEEKPKVESQVRTGSIGEYHCSEV